MDLHELAQEIDAHGHCEGITRYSVAHLAIKEALEEWETRDDNSEEVRELEDDKDRLNDKLNRALDQVGELESAVTKLKDFLENS